MPMSRICKTLAVFFFVIGMTLMPVADSPVLAQTAPFDCDWSPEMSPIPQTENIQNTGTCGGYCSSNANPTACTASCMGCIQACANSATPVACRAACTGGP